jgi:uncharacterized membrane-anchored protein
MSPVSKVPEVTLGFWIVKILATTLGETGGDAISMSLGFGYLVGTAIFAVLFVAAVTYQIRSDAFHPGVYWTTIVATTTLGTTLADFADRSLGIGYVGGTALLSALLLIAVLAWHRSLGTIAIDSIVTPKAEAFYWTTIILSQTLGTALGDWTADDAGLGYTGSALVFGGLLALLAAIYRLTSVSRTSLFWAAFVLTRPLGAVVGDFLDKPVAKGGLALSRFGASAALLGAMVVLLLMSRQRPAPRAH